MITDANKATAKIKAALTMAGYTVRVDAQSTTQLHVRDRQDNDRGSILVGKYVDSTARCTLKVRRIAQEASAGC